MFTDGFKGAASFNAAFSKLKEGLLSMDPVWWCENNLTLDGEVFRLHGNGYKPFSDIYRYIGIKALETDGKPVVIVKGRQVGATTMAAALELYLMACGLFGTQNRSPVRVMHCFPLLDLAYTYTKTKLNPMISAAILDEETAKTSKPRSRIETKIDNSTGTADSLKLKQFVNGNQILIESTGLTADRIRGRQLCLETELPTPTGFVKLKNLKEGDLLFDEQGNICSVTKLHPIQQSPESYRITFDDGSLVDACAEHLWDTYTKRDRINLSKGKEVIPQTKNTKEIFETLKVRQESNHAILNSKPIKQNYKELEIDPYLLGLWLGDGNRHAQIETADPEVLENFDHHVIESSIDSHSNWGVSRSRSYGIKGLCASLKKVGLVFNPSPTRRGVDKGYYKKHIPDEYKNASFDQRLALLQGLMDSDGCCYKDGRCEFVQVREQLSKDVYDLICSLGIKARIRKKESWRYNVRYQDKFQIMFMTDLPVFRLKRKLERLPQKLTNKSKYRFIRSVEPIDSKPMRCITVDSPSHLYLITRSYIPTHNTVDCIFYDECQDISSTAIANANKTLSQAKYGPPGSGAQVYFGTPKQKGSAFWDIWQQSSQQYYYLGCEECEEYFPLYTPGSNDWEDIWIEDDFAPDYKDPKTGLKPHGFVVKCTHCGHEQDKRPAAERGKWMPLKGEEFDNKFVGYHINQLYMPHLSRSKVIGEKPENNPINTERAYQNEVLGEFFAGDAAPITADQIEEICADKKRTFRRSIGLSENKRVYVGADWGQKIDADALAVGEKGKRQRGQSYSSVVVLSAEGPGILSIEYAKLLKKNDLEYKKAFIDETFRRYSVHLGVGDIGYANDLTEILQRDYNDRFLASRAVGSVKHHAKVSLDTFPKEIAFERDYYIAELFDLMKAGKIRFPYGSYEQIGWLVQHCCSMEIKPTIDRSGNVGIRYVKGSTPNDGFMALLNAYLAYKFDITKGFEIKNPNRMREDPSKPEPPAAIAAHLPGLNSWKRDGMRRRR
jgi:hypothetical protein